MVSHYLLFYIRIPTQKASAGSVTIYVSLYSQRWPGQSQFWKRHQMLCIGLSIMAGHAVLIGP